MPFSSLGNLVPMKVARLTALERKILICIYPHNIYGQAGELRLPVCFSALICTPWCLFLRHYIYNEELVTLSPWVRDVSPSFLPCRLLGLLLIRVTEAASLHCFALAEECSSLYLSLYDLLLFCQGQTRHGDYHTFKSCEFGTGHISFVTESSHQRQSDLELQAKE